MKQIRAKGPFKKWKPEEDHQLVYYASIHKHRNWKTVSEDLEKLGIEKSPSSCYQRWHNHLLPELDRSPFTNEEKRTIERLHLELGNNWVEIARRVPGRSANAIKNLCNKKKKAAPGNPSFDADADLDECYSNLSPICSLD